MSAHHDAAVASDKQYMLHGYTDLSEHEVRGPVIITRGEGVRVFDDAGRDYIEAASGMWCATFGFSEQALIDAAVEQFARAALLPHDGVPVGKSRHRACRTAGENNSTAGCTYLLRTFRLRSQRLCRQVPSLLQQRYWAPKEEKGHLSH